MDVKEEYVQSRKLLFKEKGIDPSSKKVLTNGPVKHVHYLEMGSGKPLVMIHGGGSHCSEWIDILEPLSQHYHLFVVDRPGHGLTDPFNYRGVDYANVASDFVNSFVQALNLPKVLVCGNSMGGYFGLRFAFSYPEKVDKLLLIGAPAGINHWIPYLLRLLGIRGLNQLLVKTVAKPSVANMRNIYKQILVADIDNVSELFLRHCYYHQLLPGYMEGFTTMLENVLTLQGWNKKLYIGEQLGKLKMPVKFILGDNDAFEKPDTIKPKTSGIRDCQFEVVENAGHCPWFDQPEICASLGISMLAD